MNLRQVSRRSVWRSAESRLTLTYLVALGGIALLAIGATALFWRSLEQHSGDARLLNLAGRQRMLSQRISKDAVELQLPLPGEARQRILRELSTSLAEWSKIDLALRSGEPTDFLTFTRSHDADLRLRAMERTFQRMLRAANQVQRQTDPDAWKAVLAEEGEYLKEMDATVFLFEAESSARVERLKRMVAGFVVILFALLASLGVFLFRPVQRRIHQDMETIEEADRQLRESNAVLSRQAVELQEVSRLKSEFLASVSHELRTPLNGIIGFTELLEDGRPGPLNERQQRYVHNILTSSRHLLRLINNLLDFAKIEAGRMEVFPEPVELAEMVQEAVDHLQPIALERQVRVHVDVPAEASQAHLDPNLLRQILYNYLSNALKFSPAGGKVSVRVRLHEGGVRLEVQDEGPGIRPEEVPQLFQQFRQLHGGGKKHSGTGLGLALVKRIAEAQGGIAGVETEPGRGSLFYVELPAPQEDIHSSSSNL